MSRHRADEEPTTPQYAIDSGWLVELVNKHTCGTAVGGYYGAHEPGCGMVPIAKVDDLLRALSGVQVSERIPEPGIWGVVEAGCVHDPTGIRTWVRWPDGDWYTQDGGDEWTALLDPTLIRDGIAP